MLTALASRNDEATGSSEISSLKEMIAFMGRAYADRVGVTFLDGAKKTSFTYGDIYHRAQKVAGAIHRAGIHRGDRVLIILHTSPSFLDAFFGILLAGATPVPMSPPHSLKGMELEEYAQTLQRVATDSGAKACLSQSALLWVLRGELAKANDSLQILDINACVESNAPYVDAIVDTDDVALLQYTSGSTSAPKGVELTHRNLLSNIAAIRYAFGGGRKDDITVSWLPLYHDMGLIGGLLTSIRAHVPVVLLSPIQFIKNPLSWLKALSDHKATITVAPNFAFGYCVKSIAPEDMAGLNLASVRVMLNGAEPVDVKVVETFHEALAPYGLKPHVVLPAYGLAESSLAVTFTPPGPWYTLRLDADALEHEGKAVPANPGGRARMIVSAGRPLPTQEVQIVDEWDVPVPDLQVGEILVRGPSVMRGYFNQPKATAETLRGGWLHTGDYGFLSKGHLFIAGRKKDVIIRRGKNYYPQDIEFQASKIDGVRKGSVVVFAVDEGGDCEVTVVAETRVQDAGKREQMTKEMVDRLAHLFLFKPKEVHWVLPGTIPKTTSGKVRRQECKKRLLDGSLHRTQAASRWTAAHWMLQSAWETLKSKLA